MLPSPCCGCMLRLLLQGSVREQLHALCDASPVCAPARLRKQRAAVEQLQSDREHLQAEVSTLRMQLEHSKARVLQLQRQLQQQLTAAPNGKRQG